MKCYACGKGLSKKEALYTEDRKTYCKNPFECTEEHPNSVKNIVERGGAERLYSEEELGKVFFKDQNISEEVKERVIRLATRPQSLRIMGLDVAYYVLMLQKEKGLSSISEAVRYCILKTMEVEPISLVSDSDDEKDELMYHTEVPPSKPLIKTAPAKSENDFVF